MNRASVGSLASSLLAATLTAIGSAPLMAGGFVVQDQTTPGVTPASLAQSLAGNGVTITNVTYTGTLESSGQFLGGNSIIGFDEGVILSSGWAIDVIGPNTADATSRSLGTGGDADLTLLSGNTTFDKTLLEFDFVPTSSFFAFQYVFGSEEYNEFVNSSFNDVFAFFVNGVNCATVGNPPEPVSINTINNGDPFGTLPNSNPQLYRNNDPDDPGPPTIDTGADGLTVVLSCFASVNANVPNHIKLAIADATDSGYDSYVFLKAESFVSGNMSIDDVSLSEAGGLMNFTVTRAGSSLQPATITYATANGTATAPGDYTPVSGSLFFAPGATAQPVTVPIVNDILDENDETVFVNLSNPFNAAIADGQGVGTILDDDATPTLSIADCAVTEGATGTTNCNFAAALSSPSSFTVTAAFATADGTAVAPADYVAATGVLTFAPGATARTLPIAVAGDNVDENDETYVVSLSTPVGATIGDGQATGTILDDDAVPAISMIDCAAIEGDTGATPCPFVATLSRPSSFTVTATYTTSDGTATAGIDYTAASGPLSFAPLVTSQPIDVSVLGDTDVEVDETILVGLSAPTNATLGDAQGQGSILDDDAASLSTLELTHGTRHTADLAGGSPDLYRIYQRALSSYEIVVDGPSGDVAPSLLLERLAADNTTVLQVGSPVAGGSSSSLRWENGVMLPITSQHVRISGGACGGTCDLEDVYRVRAWDTTLALPRFNNSATQLTVAVLHNEGSGSVSGHLNFWRASTGVLLHSEPFTLAPRATLVLNTSVLPGLQGQGGAATVSHDGPYGSLVGKAVAVEPATGFTFDTPFLSRPR